jgi:hypothetical protein
VGARVSLKADVDLSLHEAHAKLVEPIAFAAMRRIKNDDAEHIFIRVV